MPRKRYFYARLLPGQEREKYQLVKSGLIIEVLRDIAHSCPDG